MSACAERTLSETAGVQDMQVEADRGVLGLESGEFAWQRIGGKAGSAGDFHGLGIAAILAVDLCIGAGGVGSTRRA